MPDYTLKTFQVRFLAVISWISLFSGFVLFEETVIDRSQLRYMIPGYRPADPCIWDLASALIFLVIVYLVFRKGSSANIAANDG